MPLLGALLSGLFASLASFFATFLTKKVAFGAAALAVFAAVTVVFMAVIATSINVSLAALSPPTWFLVGFNLFMPTNFVPCVSAIIGAYVALVAYRYHVETLKIISFVT